MLTAAISWITASAIHATRIQATIAPQSQDITFWGVIFGSHALPPSYGLVLFALAALATIMVLPVLAFAVLVVVCLCVVTTLAMVWLAIIAVWCVLAMCGACSEEEKVKVEVEVYPYRPWCGLNDNYN